MRFAAAHVGLLVSVVFTLGGAACSSADSTTATAPTPPAVVEPAAAPPGSEIGVGDGTAASVTLTQIYAPGAEMDPVDLAFRGDTSDELWLVGYGDNTIHRGAGLTTDWTWARAAVPRFSVPVWLAGGITPVNAAAALAAVDPAGLDVASGAELPGASRGEKDRAKIVALLAACRASWMTRAR